MTAFGLAKWSKRHVWRHTLLTVVCLCACVSYRWFSVFPILLVRNGQNYLRNPGCLMARVIMVLMVAVSPRVHWRS